MSLPIRAGAVPCGASPIADLVRAALVAFAPLLGAVCVADGHPHDRDRMGDTCDRSDPRDPPGGSDDDLAVDALPDQPVRRADVVPALRRDRRGLEPQSTFA